MLRRNINLHTQINIWKHGVHFYQYLGLIVHLILTSSFPRTVVTYAPWTHHSYCWCCFDDLQKKKNQLNTPNCCFFFSQRNWNHIMPWRLLSRNMKHTTPLHRAPQPHFHLPWIRGALCDLSNTTLNYFRSLADRGETSRVTFKAVFHSSANVGFSGSKCSP